MRCIACDRNLSDAESTRKDHNTGKYVDLCNQCIRSVNEDLSTDEYNEFNYEE